MENENAPQIKVARELGRKRVSFLAWEDGTEYVTLPVAVWGYGAVVSALVRLKYSEDDVEAITGNALLLLSSSETVSEDEATEKRQELEEFQEYREKCKARAKVLVELGSTEYGLEEMKG